MEKHLKHGIIYVVVALLTLTVILIEPVGLFTFVDVFLAGFLMCAAGSEFILMPLIDECILVIDAALVIAERAVQYAKDCDKKKVKKRRR